MDRFVYNQARFKFEVMDYFLGYSKKETISEILNGYDKIGAKLKKRLLKRIKLCESGEEWWVNVELGGRTTTTNELLHLWNIVNDIKKMVIYDGISVEDYAQARLEEARQKVENGEITEQQYIDKCNWIKKCKEADEELMNACKCNVIGDMSEIFGEVVLRIVCLPCGWDTNSSVINF